MFRNLFLSMIAVALMGSLCVAGGDVSQKQLDSFGLGGMKTINPVNATQTTAPLADQAVPAPPAIPGSEPSADTEGDEAVETKAPTDFTITVSASEDDNELTTDPGYGVKYTKERVIKLPRDANKFFVTVIGKPEDARFNQVKGWFKDVPELALLKRQTNFNEIPTTQADYKERYAKTVPATPLIRVQTAKGEVLYQVSGTNLPMSGQALSRSINTEFLRRWRERRIDNRQNNNDADDQADDEEDQPDDEEGDGDALRDTVPDVVPPLLMSHSDSEILVIAVLLGVLVVGGFCAVQSAKNRHHQ